MAKRNSAQDGAQSAFGLLKAGEQGADKLTRCADLVPMAMLREQCDLAAAVGHVVQRLGELTEPDVFIIREGYAKPWQPRLVRLSGCRWVEGEPVPLGYRVGYDSKLGLRFISDAPMLFWIGPGPEPVRSQTHAELWHELGAKWSSLLRFGDIDRRRIGGAIAWSSSLAIRSHVAASAGMLSGVALPASSDTAVLHLVAHSASPQIRIDAHNIEQPAGGAWPHVSGADWTEAERVAVFKMRHISKMTGERIAAFVGVRRQVVDEQIGGATSPATGNWPHRCRWRPSNELLVQCGFASAAAQGSAVQALHILAAPGRLVRATLNKVNQSRCSCVIHA